MLRKLVRADLRDVRDQILEEIRELRSHIDDLKR